MVGSSIAEGGGVGRSNMVASFFEPVGWSLVTWGCGSARGTICVPGEVVSGPEYEEPYLPAAMPILIVSFKVLL